MRVQDSTRDTCQQDDGFDKQNAKNSPSYYRVKSKSLWQDFQ